MKGVLLFRGRTMQQPMDRAHALPRQAQPNPKAIRGSGGWGCRWRASIPVGAQISLPSNAAPPRRLATRFGAHSPPRRRRHIATTNRVWPVGRRDSWVAVAASVPFLFFFACSVLYFCPPCVCHPYCWYFSNTDFSCCTSWHVAGSDPSTSSVARELGALAVRTLVKHGHYRILKLPILNIIFS